MHPIRCPACHGRASIGLVGRCSICTTPIIRPMGALALVLTVATLTFGGIFLRARATATRLQADTDGAEPSSPEPSVEAPASGEPAVEGAPAAPTPAPAPAAGVGAPVDAGAAATASLAAEAQAVAARALCAAIDSGPAWDEVCACLAERARSLPPLSPTEDRIGFESPPRLRERPYVRAFAECSAPYHQARARAACDARCRNMSVSCDRVCACVASPALVETGFTPEGDKHLLARGEPQALYRRMLLCEDELRRGMRYPDGEYLVVPGFGQGRLDHLRVTDPTFRAPPGTSPPRR